jgi:lipid-A-disaccharide synthase
LRVGLVAGEASGDTLGAGLIRAIRRLAPQAQFFGVAGPKMLAEGCESWEPAESLAVMGLVEIVRDLPRLIALRARIQRRFLVVKPDVFVGIDAPEFNLHVARNLRLAGIPTVQYVSPQVWAWRRGRVRSIYQAVDLVLCLLPFEKRFYEAAGVPAEFVGHPLADAIPMVGDRAAARAALGCGRQASVIALLPGSRRGEVMRLSGDFAYTADWLKRHRPELEFVAPMAGAGTREIFSEAMLRLAPDVKVKFIEGQAQTALTAADVVLVASGTATLEAALCKRPMVVVYRLGRLSTWIFRRLKLFKSKYFAQPNLLADRQIVGEYFQEAIVPAVIGAEILKWLDDAVGTQALQQEFARIHLNLKRDASTRAAEAIIGMLAARAAGAVRTAGPR